MKKTIIAKIILLLVVFLAGCVPTSTPSRTIEPTSALSPTALEPTPTIVEAAPEPTEEPSEPEPAITQITIDGDPSDWASYEVLLTDPDGDHQDGGFDITAVRAFVNDQYLYVLIETHESPTDYVQVDLDIEVGERHFIVTFKPEENSSANLGEIISDQFNPVGEISGSSSAAAQAVEFKAPLSALDNAVDLTLRDVRPMGGECCDKNWYPIDNIKSISVAQLGEVEPISDMAEGSLVPQVCADEIASPIPFGTLDPAPVQLTQPSYTAEWFVAPGAFNMPQEVFVTSEGELLVYAVRSHKLSRIAEDGTVSLLAEDVWGYLGDLDAQGNVYLHFHPGGRVERVTVAGVKSVLVDSPELSSNCDSGFGFGPDGNLYLALNPCGDLANLFQITLSGEFTHLAEVQQLQALRTAPDDRFLAASCDQVFELSLDDYSLTSLGRIRSSNCVSPGGLAVDEVGNIYISTGARKPGGEVYRLGTDGEITLLAEISSNGLSGIEWLPSTGEIVGGQLRQGGLIAVGQDGTLREIVSGTGIITPMGIGFSPCGELAVPNDDGGMMALVSPFGEVSWFMDYLSFISPIPYVAFDSDGTLYASEAAPGLFPVRVAVVKPGEMLRTLIDANMPTGLALRSDGTLFVAETGEGRIVQVNSDRSTSVFVDGLDYPQALVLDVEGNLYTVIGTGWDRADELIGMPSSGDAIIRITPKGEITTVVWQKGVTGLAVSPGSDLFVTVGSDVVRISPTGAQTLFATGFEHAIGLAFDLAGNLYVSDEHQNGIVRIGGFPQGTLSGIITDASGAPVEGARVQALSVDPIVIGQIVFTDADGRFSLPAAPRVYRLIVSAEGYLQATLEGVEVNADEEVIIEIQLEE